MQKSEARSLINSTITDALLKGYQVYSVGRIPEAKTQKPTYVLLKDKNPNSLIHIPNVNASFAQIVNAVMRVTSKENEPASTTEDVKKILEKDILETISLGVEEEKQQNTQKFLGQILNVYSDAFLQDVQSKIQTAQMGR